MSKQKLPEDEVGATSAAAAREAEDASLLAHEEKLSVGKERGEVGAVRARKRVETRNVSEVIPRRIEHFDEVERVAASEGDSGEIETLPDGAVSIPILEEELVVTKRTVVRERVIVRKRSETEDHRVEAELRKEHVEVEGDEVVEEEE